MNGNAIGGMITGTVRVGASAWRRLILTVVGETPGGKDKGKATVGRGIAAAIIPFKSSPPMRSIVAKIVVKNVGPTPGRKLPTYSHPEIDTSLRTDGVPNGAKVNVIVLPVVIAVSMNVVSTTASIENVFGGPTISRLAIIRTLVPSIPATIFLANTVAIAGDNPLNVTGLRPNQSRGCPDTNPLGGNENGGVVRFGLITHPRNPELDMISGDITFSAPKNLI